MRKSTIIVIAAIFVASMVIVGVFGTKAANFEQKLYIKDIELPKTIGGQPVRTSDNIHYTVNLTYTNGLQVDIDYDKSPRDAQGDIELSIIQQIPLGEGEVVAELVQTKDSDTPQLKFLQPGLVKLRFDAVDGSKVYKELTVVARLAT